MKVQVPHSRTESVNGEPAQLGNSWHLGGPGGRCLGAVSVGRGDEAHKRAPGEHRWFGLRWRSWELKSSGRTC